MHPEDPGWAFFVRLRLIPGLDRTDIGCITVEERDAKRAYREVRLSAGADGFVRTRDEMLYYEARFAELYGLGGIYQYQSRGRATEWRQNSRFHTADRSWGPHYFSSKHGPQLQWNAVSGIEKEKNMIGGRDLGYIPIYF